MTRTLKKLLSAAIALIMVLSMVPAMAFAATVEVTDGVSYTENAAGWVEIGSTAEFNDWFRDTAEDSITRAAAKAGKTVTAKLILKADIELNVAAYVGTDDYPAEHNITLDLNGHTITSKDNESGRRAFCVYTGTLNLINSKETGGIEMPGILTATGGIIYSKKGNINMNNITIKRTEATARNYYCGILGLNGGSYVFEDCVFDAREAGSVKAGGVMYLVAGGQVVSNNSQYLGGKAVDASSTSDKGGCIHILSGTFTMNGGLISGGYTPYYGGNVYLGGGDCVFTMNDGIIENGSAQKDADHTAAPRGSNLYIYAGKFIMNGGQIREGSVSGVNGASIYVQSIATAYFYLNGGEISHSTVAASSGVGGLITKGSSAHLIAHGGKITTPKCTSLATYFASDCNEITAQDANGTFTITPKNVTAGTPVAATCTEAGYTPYTCGVCGETANSEIVMPTGHTAKTVAGKEATCTAYGMTAGSVCSVCDKPLAGQYLIKKKAHTEEVIPGKAPTCTDTGLTEGKKCSVCGETITAQEEIAAASHTVVVDQAVPATCTTTGLTEGSHCGVCGEVIVAQEVTSMTGHAWDEGVIDPAPTCNGAGVKTYTCGNCGETKTEAVEATGHTVVVDAAVAATCSTTGLTEGSHCSVCNEVIVAQEIVPTLPHTEVIDEAVAATCTTTGLTEGSHCGICGEVIVAQEVTPMTGHAWDEGKVDPQPTCNDAGVRTYTCTACGETKTEAVEATGHTEVTDAAVAPDCTNTGLTEGSHCDVCGAVIVAQEIVDALGHSYTGVYTEPTFEADGFTTYTCANCGDSYVETDEGSKLNAAARIGEQSFGTLAAAVEAAAEGDTIVVMADAQLTETLVIPADKTVTLDLAGCTVSMEDSSAKAAQLIKNDGNLTVMDSVGGGKLTFRSTTPSTAFNYSTSTVVNAGQLKIVSGTVENTTSGGASYAIDNAWYTKDVSLTVEGGTMKATSIAIRQVLFSTTARNTVNISGGVMEGSTAGLQVHNYQTTACLSEVNITGGTFTGTYGFYTTYSYNNTATGTDIEISGGTFTGYVYLYNGKNGSAEYPMSISVTGGSFDGGYCAYGKDSSGAAVAIPSVKGGSFVYDVSEYCAEGYGVQQNADGTYGVHEHKYEAAVTLPTCTTSGLTVYTCSVCNDSYEDGYVEAFGHQWDEGVIDPAPTCNGAGTKTYTCTVCGETKTEVVDATGHTPVVDAAKAPTCTDTGLTEGSHCDVCGEIIVAQEIVDALGHSYNGVYTEPAYGVDGYTTYTCTVCGDSYVETDEGSAVTGVVIESASTEVIAEANTDAQFFCNAVGSELVYTWEYSRSGSTWFTTTMEGQGTSVLTVPATLARNGYQYRCIVTDAYGNQAVMTPATLTVNEPADAAVITGQPASQSVFAGQRASFVITAEGSGLTYAWEYSKNGTTWHTTAMEGYDTAELKVIATLARNGYQYRCVVTDEYGNVVTSEAAVMTVTEAEISTEGPDDQIVVGGKVYFTVDTVAEGLTYKWQYQRADGTKWFYTTMEGCNTNTLTVIATTARSGYKYRCIITDEYGNKTISEEAILIVE